MAELDYKTVTAPRRLKKVKGVKGPEELLAYAIGEIIAAQAAEGWRYLRSDRFIVEEKTGFFSSSRTVERTVMVFARERRRTMKATQHGGQQAGRQVQAHEPVLDEPSFETPPELGGARRD